jgi:glycosyltransferase involved in cell wall biosynthesis
MKVLFICPAFPPTVCGVGDYTARLIKALSVQDLNVSLITEKPVKNPSEYGITKVYNVPNWNRLQSSKIKEAILSINPDIVHIQYQQALFHPGWLGLSLPRLIKKWRSTIKVLITQHDLNYPYLFKGAGRLGLRRISVMKTMWRHADGIVMGYGSGLAKLAGVCPEAAEKLNLIPIGPGIELEKTVKGDKEEVCRKYGFDPAMPLLASFGFIYRDKDFPGIFEAMKILQNRGVLANFIHVGSQGAETTYLEELKLKAENTGLSGRVVFAGTLDDKDAGTILRSADIGLSIFTDERDLGRHSTLPVMLQIGKPLVVTTQSGLSQDPWQTVSAGQPDSLAKAILGLLADDVLSRKLANEAMIRYEKEFSPRSIGEKTIALYRKLL